MTVDVASQSVIIEQLKQDGNVLWKDENFIGALEIFNQALKLPCPEEIKCEMHSKLFLNVSRCLTKFQALALSVENAKKAKQSRPGWFKPYECLAEILLAQGKYAGASNYYRKALKLVNDTQKDILNNLEGDNLRKRIKFYEAQMEKCEIYKGNPDGLNETEDEVKYRQLPICDIIPDLKILFGQNPNMGENKSTSSEQPVIHRILSYLCCDYNVPTIFCNLDHPEIDLGYLDFEQKLDFMQRFLPRCCRCRRNVLMNITGDINSSWMEWTVDLYHGSEICGDNKCVGVISIEDEVENFQICDWDRLSEEINVLLRLTVIRSLNPKSVTRTAPITITINGLGFPLDEEKIKDGFHGTTDFIFLEPIRYNEV